MIVIDDEALKQAGISESEMKLEIAILLYDKEVYSLRKAAKYAGVDWQEFSRILAKRGIETIRITPEELMEQVKNLEQLRKEK